ncbi:protein kinase [Striga asiatica]|uniref:Protein kinase n=1 Tax=Striga asiatica TaxID=4170 RepID=A0A5A7P6J5_STRAF|nr:protein kinase [Striga asiatica]
MFTWRIGRSGTLSDGERSVVTRLAGTFGYGQNPNKSGRVQLRGCHNGAANWHDGPRARGKPVSGPYLWQVKSSVDKLWGSIDTPLDVKDEARESVSILANLAGHCTARPNGGRLARG